jgi:hypothetical protein
VGVSFLLEARNDPGGRVLRNNGQRAQRVPLHLPLRYRSRGDLEWHEGRVENISRSGVLFSTARLVDVDTELEMTFELPVAPRPPAILCRGRVVRTVAAGAGGWHPALAATIAVYRFLRP